MQPDSLQRSGLLSVSAARHQGRTASRSCPKKLALLFRRNIFPLFAFSFSFRHLPFPQPCFSTPKRAFLGALPPRSRPNSQLGESESGGETSASGCRHRGESDGRSGARLSGFFFFITIAAVQDNSHSSSHSALMSFRVS